MTDDLAATPETSAMSPSPPKTAKIYAVQSVQNLCDLPIELLELIFGYLSYDEVAKVRVVCRQFDACAQRLLNRGFHRVEKYHALCFKKVKAQLPRRESERRNHALARHCDVLSAIETRLSLLGMTYMKYIEVNLCCFIPGKVIDEIYRVLRFIQGNPNPPRVHELLQELRDISSMAMEFFEEKIAPSLKSRHSASTSVIGGVPTPIGAPSLNRSFSASSSTSPIYPIQKTNPFTESENKTNGVVKQIQVSQNTIKKELNEIKIKLKDISQLRRDMTTIKNKLKDSDKVSLEKDQTIAELRAELEEVKRRMNEVDKKSGLKPIKDEEQIQKETKGSKRKSTRSPKTSAKKANISPKVMPKKTAKSVAVTTTTTRQSRSRRSVSAVRPSTPLIVNTSSEGTDNKSRKTISKRGQPTNETNAMKTRGKRAKTK